MKKLFRSPSSRRTFITNSAKASVLLPFASSAIRNLHRPLSASSILEDPVKPLKILILGGTSFLGPHQIAYALERGHSITTFTRGKTIPKIHTDKFDQVEQLIGDREDNLESLKGRKWDVVLDNSGRKVSWTKATAELLKDHTDFYIYTSSISVYYPYYKSGVDETDEVVLEFPSDMEEEERRLYDYGIMKANSELEARKAYGDDRAAIVRPHFMTGPGDRTDRFMYWPTRLAKGGDIILPGANDDPVQFIDVRDIAEWMIRLGEKKTRGTFNGAGPASPITMPAYVYGAHAAFSSKVNIIQINDLNFLKENEIRFLTPWLLGGEKFHGMTRVKNNHAIKNGLTFRPLAKTIHDTHEWWYSDAVSDERRVAYESNPEAMHNRQVAILSKWEAWDR